MNVLELEVSATMLAFPSDQWVLRHKQTRDMKWTHGPQTGKARWTFLHMALNYKCTYSAECRHTYSSFGQRDFLLCEVTYAFSCWQPPLPPCCCGGGFHSESSPRSDAGSASWCPPGRGCWPGCRGAASACGPSWHWTLCAVSCPAGPAGSLRTWRYHDGTNGMFCTHTHKSHSHDNLIS